MKEKDFVAFASPLTDATCVSSSQSVPERTDDHSKLLHELPSRPANKKGNRQFSSGDGLSPEGKDHNKLTSPTLIKAPKADRYGSSLKKSWKPETVIFPSNKNVHFNFSERSTDSFATRDKANSDTSRSEDFISARSEVESESKRSTSDTPQKKCPPSLSHRANHTRACYIEESSEYESSDSEGTEDSARPRLRHCLPARRLDGRYRRFKIPSANATASRQQNKTFESRLSPDESAKWMHDGRGVRFAKGGSTMNVDDSTALPPKDARGFHRGKDLRRNSCNRLEEPVASFHISSPFEEHHEADFSPPLRNVVHRQFFPAAWSPFIPPLSPTPFERQTGLNDPYYSMYHDENTKRGFRVPPAQHLPPAIHEQSSPGTPFDPWAENPGGKGAHIKPRDCSLKVDLSPRQRLQYEPEAGTSSPYVDLRFDFSHLDATTDITREVQALNALLYDWNPFNVQIKESGEGQVHELLSSSFNDRDLIGDELYQRMQQRVKWGDPLGSSPRSMECVGERSEGSPSESECRESDIATSSDEFRCPLSESSSTSPSLTETENTHRNTRYPAKENHSTNPFEYLVNDGSHNMGHANSGSSSRSQGSSSIAIFTQGSGSSGTGSSSQTSINQSIQAHNSDRGNDEDKLELDQLNRNFAEECEPRKLACPFFKRNPTQYTSSKKFRSCCGPGWAKIHHLK